MPHRSRSAVSRDPDLELFMVRSPAAFAPNGVLPARRDDGLVSRLPVLPAALEQQRDFRREQLTQVDRDQRTCRSPRTNGAAGQDHEAVLARRVVEALVAAGARRALADIELALVRMRTGHYGYCRTRGAVPSWCSRRFRRPRCAWPATGSANTPTSCPRLPTPSHPALPNPRDSRRVDTKPHGSRLAVGAVHLFHPTRTNGVTPIASATASRLASPGEGSAEAS